MPLRSSKRLRRLLDYKKWLEYPILPWNEAFLRELENFPEGGHDDIVDALSGAFLMLTDSTYDLTALTTL